MLTISGDGKCTHYGCLVIMNCGSIQLAWSKGQQPAGAVCIHSSDEPSELLQWHCMIAMSRLLLLL